ncbi:energy transducer TonB [Pseudoxanthomonas sp. 22568]|uniref:energy transducer TonB n=1 Tax=Pseudoxanthomonas sp. 22568 TaxID=3453945 RepID=UPI003F8769A1
MIMEMRGMGRWLAIALLLGIACTAVAGIKEVRAQVEASMLVTGAVIIEPDGTVAKLDLDQREKLPPAVAGLIDKAAASWKFEPILVDGVGRRGKARMSLRVVANKLPNGDFQVALRGGHFGDEAISPEERQKRNDSVRSVKLLPPAYPGGVARAGAQGTVYLVVKVARDGTVADVIAEQVNLGFVGNERLMQQARDAFSESALAVAKKWIFRPPTEGAEAAAPFWLVRVPVDYKMPEKKAPGYGRWEVYVPGPRQSAPWMQSEHGGDDAPDAMVAGGVYEIGKGRRLLTPLSG